MNEQELSIKLLKDAAKTLDTALKIKPLNDIVRDAVIQRFEYTYEITWKTLKRYFESNQKISEFNIKNIWREAARMGLLDNVEVWFEFHKARNETSHTYSKKVARMVFSQAKKFNLHIKKLIKSLENILE